jgi:hypothetical protein
MYRLQMYLDDTWLVSKSLEEHTEHLWLVLRLHEHEYHTKHAKCRLNQPESAQVPESYC